MKQENEIENLNFKHKLQDDNVFVNNYVVNLQDVTGMPTRKGLERAIICEDQIVNVVSKSYGHLPNDKFFYEENQSSSMLTSVTSRDQLTVKTVPSRSTIFYQMII